jgi:hypothetical protein
MDTICSNEAPDTTFELFGHRFAMPVLFRPDRCADPALQYRL